jgi:hypothetical protein
MTTNIGHLHTVVSGDGAAILDVERGVITTLNATGGYVWERLQRRESLESIVTGLAEETGEDPALVRSDVDLFVSQLESVLLFETPQNS